MQKEWSRKEQESGARKEGSSVSAAFIAISAVILAIKSSCPFEECVQRDLISAGWGFVALGVCLVLNPLESLAGFSWSLMPMTSLALSQQ